MFDFPITLSVQDKLILVVGYGTVGQRKVATFLAAGAKVRVIDPTCKNDSLPQRIEFYNRPFHQSDVYGAYLVCVAVDDSVVEDEVVAAAKKAGIWVNVAGNPKKGDFALPAVLRHGDLHVAVSTGGGSPAVSVAVRDQIAEFVGPEWSKLLEIVAQLRGDRLTESDNSEYNRRILTQLIEGNALKLISENNREGLDALLTQIKLQ